MRSWPVRRAKHPFHAAALASGAAIVNARGIPGTLGFLARTRHDGQPVLVSSHHVLFGDGAREGDPLWCATRESGAFHIAFQAGDMVELGRVAYGRAGVIRLGAADVWVDAAVATLSAELLDSVGCDLIDDPVDAVATQVGATATKRGAATGSTTGTIASVDYLDRTPRRADRPDAPNQLLVEASPTERPFLAEGDSGSALRDANGFIVGLLWGMTPRGDGVACPIDAVLHVLHLRVARPVPRTATIAATMRDR